MPAPPDPGSCRNLRCTRNYIHANLFASFGLRATSVMVKDALLERRWGVELVQVADWEALLSHEARAGLVAAWGHCPGRGWGGVGVHAAPDTPWVHPWGASGAHALPGCVLGVPVGAHPSITPMGEDLG